MNAELAGVLASIDEAYDRRSWHGTNLRGSIRGLSAKEALWRPGSGRHNIWEIVVHAAYWKYTVRRRLLGEKRGSFPLKGSNWFPSPSSAEEKAWTAAVDLLGEVHRSMRLSVRDLDHRLLHRKAAGSKVTNDFLLRGIAAHDLYHAGQIQLIKRLRAG
jgi:uncharacterized damage-inducible protein DinB